MKKKNGTKPQSAFGRMGKRVSQKKERGLLDELNKKRKLFSYVPCIKELVQKEKQGDKEVEKVVLKEGVGYTIFDSGLHLGDGKTYYGITMSILNESSLNSLSIETHPATLFFEAEEVEEYFDLGKKSRRLVTPFKMLSPLQESPTM